MPASRTPIPSLRLLASGIAVVSMAFLATAAFPIELGDHHLNFIPRTPSEADRVADVTAPTSDFSRPEPYEARPAGAATVAARTNSAAFSNPSGNISFEREFDFKIGDGLFRKLWVSSPSSTLASDGLGPLFSARSCQRCHIEDGRGHPPSAVGDNAISFVFRVTVPDESGAGRPMVEGHIPTLPDPVYGEQLQEFSVAGHPAEYSPIISYEEIEVVLSEGETATLRKPTYDLGNLGYGPLHPKAALSPRVAPQMIGMGLLEAIPNDDILANADPDDSNGDGISGRPNIVWSVDYDRPMLGRFGHKAATPTVRQQAAGAFSKDIGISNHLFPSAWGDCTMEQKECVEAHHGDRDASDRFEIGSLGLELVTHYSRNLAVPARRDITAGEVLRGKQVFYETGCISCHTPKFVTHRLKDQPEQSFQLIWPYTDLLLHDMGQGLADNSPQGRATGSEWRTPPLWGIGLTKTVSGHTQFLHDGRARNLLEALLWHGGEAQPMRDAVVQIPAADRHALILFLESL